jgi:hypothetical protein
MLTPTIGFVAGTNSIFQPLLGNTTDGGVSWTFQPFTSRETRAALMMCSSSIKIPVSYQEAFLTGGARLQEQQMPG